MEAGQYQGIKYFEKIKNDDFTILLVLNSLFIVKKEFLESVVSSRYWIEIGKNGNIRDYKNIFYIKYLISQIDASDDSMVNNIKRECLLLFLRYLENITRLEVIDDNGRFLTIYSKHHKNGDSNIKNITLDIQDNGMTVKAFIDGSIKNEL